MRGAPRPAARPRGCLKPRDLTDLRRRLAIAGSSPRGHKKSEARLALRRRPEDQVPLLRTGSDRRTSAAGPGQLANLLLCGGLLDDLLYDGLFDSLLSRFRRSLLCAL